ncbi:MAG: serine hydrolase domain-containing protein [Planctomycetota bacterium]|jgi:CubicO group peptidase (beta-lactamase class C family)
MNCFGRLLVGLLLLSPLPAQELSQEERRGVAKIAERWDKDDAPGISVAIARGGEIVYEEGFGLAQMEYVIPIDPETIFHVASVSKQFTAFALVLCEQEGLLDLDDDVRKYVPWLHDFGKTITIRHLLNHTSGIRDQWELLAMSGYRLDDVLTQEHILSLLRNQRELNFEPGSEYMYSNMGFSLAAEVVTAVSGETLDEFCQERIFIPLGMERSHFHQDHRHIVPERAYSYAADNGNWKKGSLSYANVGATSLFTTAPDLCRWLMNLGTGDVGGEEGIAALTTKGVFNDGKENNYALGIMVGDYKSERTWRHSGGDAGFRSEALYFPDAELAIAVLANGSITSPQRIANSLADVLLDRRLQATAREEERTEPTARESIPIDKAIMDRIIGRYTGEGMPEVVVSLRALKPHIEIVGQGNAELRRQSETEFFVNEAPIVFRFELPEDEALPANALIVVQGNRERRGTRALDVAEDPIDRTSWAGRYYSPELEAFYEIVVEEDRIYAKHRRHGKIPLKPSGKDQLAGGEFYFRKVVFEREDGEVTGFRLSGGRVQDLKFLRVE